MTNNTPESPELLELVKHEYAKRGERLSTEVVREGSAGDIHSPYFEISALTCGPG